VSAPLAAHEPASNARAIVSNDANGRANISARTGSHSGSGGVDRSGTGVAVALPDAQVEHVLRSTPDAGNTPAPLAEVSGVCEISVSTAHRFVSRPVVATVLERESHTREYRLAP
jgi:hypothetical protein